MGFLVYWMWWLVSGFQEISFTWSSCDVVIYGTQKKKKKRNEKYLIFNVLWSWAFSTAQTHKMFVYLVLGVFFILTFSNSCSYYWQFIWIRLIRFNSFRTLYMVRMIEYIYFDSRQTKKNIRIKEKLNFINIYVRYKTEHKIWNVYNAFEKGRNKYRVVK